MIHLRSVQVTIRQRQRLLARAGFDPGPIDGILGPRTRAATVAFKRARGLPGTPDLCALTIEALRAGIGFQGLEHGPGGPEWLRLAHGYLGLKEIPGPRHNAELLGWWERLALPFRDDETPWCAGFVNAMVHKAGLPIVHKNRAAALGWRWNGYGQRLSGPALGAVMSMTRPGRPGSGHMTFVAGRDARDRIMGLGGNQGDMVSINPYDPQARDAQYHFPDGVAAPARVGLQSLPLISAGGQMLENEA